MTQHEPYISRVVRALVVADITVRSWSAEQEPGEPLTASVALPVDGRLLWLGWDEQSGWWWGPDSGGERLDWVRWLDVDLLAAPEVVLYGVRRCVLGDEPGLDDAPHYRAIEDELDWFLDELAAAGQETR
jgi:hypothetical protein